MICPECGAAVEGGTAGCEALFHEMIARDFSDFRYFAVHRLVVDAYALQHPESYCRSAKSLAAHLAGLCCGLEHGGNPDVYNALQRWLNGTPPLVKPEPPGLRGHVTVVDVHNAVDVCEHKKLVYDWAESVWQAWSEHHEIARRWIGMATAGTRLPRDRV